MLADNAQVYLDLHVIFDFVQIVSFLDLPRLHGGVVDSCYQSIHCHEVSDPPVYHIPDSISFWTAFNFRLEHHFVFVEVYFDVEDWLDHVVFLEEQGVDLIR